MAQFSELYGDLLTTELHSADTTQLFTTVRRKAAVNYGQREVARLTDCCVRQVSVSLVDDTREYDLEAIAAGDFVRLAKQGVEVVRVDSGGTSYYYAGPDLPRKDIPVLNQEQPGWRAATKSTPTSYYLREDGGKVYLGFNVPVSVPAGETWTATVPYVAVPADMVLDTAVPFTFAADAKATLIHLHQAVVHFAASQLEKLRPDWDASLRQRTMAMDLVADWLKSRTPVGGSRVQYARNYRRSGAAPTGESSTSTHTTNNWIGTGL